MHTYRKKLIAIIEIIIILHFVGDDYFCLNKYFIRFQIIYFNDNHK